MTEREQLNRAIDRRNREIQRARRAIGVIEDEIERREQIGELIRGLWSAVSIGLLTWWMCSGF